MTDQSNSNATFYHYRLLKKIIFPKSFLLSYVLLPIIWLAAEMIVISWTSIFYFIIAMLITAWIQYVIARSILIVINHSYHKRWKFSYRLPWIGYMPDQYIPYSSFRKVHLHTAWIGCIIIAAIIPWSPFEFMFSLLFWHLWLMVPKQFTITGLKRQPKDGVLKLNERDLSYYKP